MGGQDSAEATAAAASPWGQDPVQTVVEQQPQEATGWADFGAFSGGGEGMEGKLEQMESTDRSSVLEEKEGWSPAMVSSPEATMLEESKDINKGEAEDSEEQSNRDGGASPLLEERLKPNDEQMQGAVEEEKKIADAASDQKKTAADNEAGDVAVVKVAESAVAQPAGESDEGAT